MRIALLKDLPDWRAHLPRVEEIFFTASAVQQFTDDAHRARFKQRSTSTPTRGPLIY